MVPQWELNGCCGNQEIVFLCFYGGYVLLFVLIYKTAIMKPMRLLAVFLHEFSHAFLCWITCGKVEAIEVNSNEGTPSFFIPFFILKGSS
jgi:Peptidase M50B-like